MCGVFLQIYSSKEKKYDMLLLKKVYLWLVGRYIVYKCTHRCRQRRSTTQNQGGANLTKTQVKYVDIRNKTIYTMINLTNHISSDYRDCQTTLNQVMD